ncbi:hypothetical protein [Paenibacillus cremeus]|nr:hypothetical protein [Paenibacillus cremeus]
MDRVAWNCLCDCGNPNYVITRGSDLTRGRTKTCGHIQNKDHTKLNNSRKNDITFGRISRIYHNMKQRCLNSNHRQFQDYGGRGIMICKEWLGGNGLDNFYQWSINNGYSQNLTIDRINVNKGYSPSNCRWATKEIQGNNKTLNIQLKISNSDI